MRYLTDDNIKRTRDFLRKVQRHSSELEKLIENNANERGYNRIVSEEVENILGQIISLDYLYYSDPSSNDYRRVCNDVSISNIQCLIYAGIYLLANEQISKKVAIYIISSTNIIGYLFDRHTFSYYVNQDNLKRFVDLLYEIDEYSENRKHSHFHNPLDLYKILNEKNFEVEQLIEKGNYGFDEYSNILHLLPKIRRKTRERYCVDSITYFKSIEAEDELGSNESIYSSFKDYEINARKVYHSLPNYPQKNIGGFVCLYDTNLEFQNLEPITDYIKVRQISELNFEKVLDANSLFNLALNNEVSIISIKIIN
ncbi:MAG: hypothetical protein K0R36_860 [Chryseobacterium sp.]|nr:hypothetical protein [Chryseobacterium sp.]